MRKGAHRLYLVAQHVTSRSGHWDFPKGHMERDEDEVQTALREVREESGVEMEIIEGFREVITFSPAPGVSKDVVFFLGKATSEKTIPQAGEINACAWLPYKEALERLTFESAREVLRKAETFLKSK